LTYCHDDNGKCFNAPCLEPAISYKRRKNTFPIGRNSQNGMKKSRMKLTKNSKKETKKI
jgi:hypothetical protein